MTTHTDEKGKYFTNVISKEEIDVIIQTSTHRIEGHLHIRSGGRLKDELNQPERFLAVTEASVYNLMGFLIYRSHFIAVNSDQINWVIPVHDLTDRGEA